MPNPRYIPRQFAKDPTLFGRSSDILWKDADLDKMSFDEEDQLLAASLQHKWAVAINDAIGRSQLESVASYADMLGKPVRQIIAKLNGEAVMRFEDIAAAHRVLGISIDT